VVGTEVEDQEKMVKRRREAELGQRARLKPGGGKKKISLVVRGGSFSRANFTRGECVGQVHCGKGYKGGGGGPEPVPLGMVKNKEEAP